MARRRSGLFYIRFQEVISHVQEHKRKQAFSGFLAFSIKKEISDRLKTLFPFFVPAAAQYVFAAEKRKTTASQGLPTVRGLFQFIMTYVFLLFVSVIMGINKSLFGPISIGNKFSHFKTKQGITFPIYVFLFQMETGIF